MLTGGDKDNIQRFILSIVDAAMNDYVEGIPCYDPRNQGSKLISRLNLHRNSPRRGDGKYARSLYTAAYWLFQTEDEK